MGRNESAGVWVASVGREEVRRVRRRRRRVGDGVERWWVVCRVMVWIREWVFERGIASSDLDGGDGSVDVSGGGDGGGDSGFKALALMSCKRVLRSAMLVGLYCCLRFEVDFLFDSMAKLEVLPPSSTMALRTSKSDSTRRG